MWLKINCTSFWEPFKILQEPRFWLLQATTEPQVHILQSNRTWTLTDTSRSQTREPNTNRTFKGAVSLGISDTMRSSLLRSDCCRAASTCECVELCYNQRQCGCVEANKAADLQHFLDLTFLLSPPSPTRTIPAEQLAPAELCVLPHCSLAHELKRSLPWKYNLHICVFVDMLSWYVVVLLRESVSFSTAESARSVGASGPTYRFPSICILSGALASSKD